MARGVEGLNVIFKNIVSDGINEGFGLEAGNLSAGSLGGGHGGVRVSAGGKIRGARRVIAASCTGNDDDGGNCDHDYLEHGPDRTTRKFIGRVYGLSLRQEVLESIEDGLRLAVGSARRTSGGRPAGGVPARPGPAAGPASVGESTVSSPES